MEDDDFDDLPPISVNTPSSSKSTAFKMPPADLLASQRAREEECERELRQLRELDEAKGGSRGDSSGSEDESSLAEAVHSLRMPPAAPAPHTPSSAADLAELLSRLLQHLPDKESKFIRNYLKLLQKGNSAMTKSVTYEVLEGLEGVLRGGRGAWEGGSVLSVGGWLCALSLGGGGLGLRLRRALHALLQQATDSQVEALGDIMCETVCSPELLLELSDAVQGAPGAPRALANHLLRVALERAERAQGAQGAEGGRGTLARAWGRAAAAGARAPLPLSALAPAPHDSHADRLKRVESSESFPVPCSALWPTVGGGDVQAAAAVPAQALTPDRGLKGVK